MRALRKAGAAVLVFSEELDELFEICDRLAVIARGRLAAELPVLRHHHEGYNGSGYPDRLLGDEIPRLARILHVADAFEAMTADRPYRKALSTEQALSELRKFAGVQFDPEIVDAFVRTKWAADTRDPGRPELRPIPLLGQHAARAAHAFDAPAPGSPAADLV